MARVSHRALRYCRMAASVDSCIAREIEGKIACEIICETTAAAVIDSIAATP